MARTTACAASTAALEVASDKTKRFVSAEQQFSFKIIKK
jgi:hypothetical protein